MPDNVHTNKIEINVYYFDICCVKYVRVRVRVC